MNYRPIGLNHSETCDSGEWDDLCDECRDNAAPDWDDDCRRGLRCDEED